MSTSIPHSVARALMPKYFELGPHTQLILLIWFALLLIGQIGLLAILATLISFHSTLKRNSTLYNFLVLHLLQAVIYLLLYVAEFYASHYWCFIRPELKILFGGVYECIAQSWNLRCSSCWKTRPWYGVSSSYVHIHGHGTERYFRLVVSLFCLVFEVRPDLTRGLFISI